MALQALLLSLDPYAQETLHHVLDRANIDLRLCRSAEEAITILNRDSLDALLVDCDDVDGAPSVLKQVRQNGINKSAITFAFLNGKTSVKDAFQLGANFVFNKPVSVQCIARSIRALHGLVQQERRRHHRHLLRATGVILVDEGSELPVTITSISRGGISIECSRRLDLRGAASLRIFLPGAMNAIQAKGEVVWSTEEGRAGIRFQILPAKDLQELQNWLDERGLPLGNHGAMFIDATSAQM
jgi:DNA-binding response OmpR family regulator